MYRINDLVMYGSIGVCRVNDISKPDFAKPDDETLYYVLEPLYQSGVIYAPVENAKVFIRPVITADEASRLIDSIPDIPTDVQRNSSMQQLTKHYQSIIDTHRCSELLKLTKSIYQKEIEAEENNRHLGQIDRKFMKRAEELLYGEFAAALSISRDDARECVRQRLAQ